VGVGSAKANHELASEAYLVEPTKGVYQIEKKLLLVAINHGIKYSQIRGNGTIPFANGKIALVEPVSSLT
jgi:hypothetical protein